jgi:uncharacterized integral membrane protein
MRIIWRILVLALVLAVGTAVFQNQESLGSRVDFAFLRWRTSLVLGFWLMFSFLGGALLFLDIWRNLRLRWEIRKRDQQIAELQRALDAKNASPTPPTLS